MKIVDIQAKVFTHKVDLADFGKGRDLILVNVITDDGTVGVSYVPGYSHIPVSLADLLAKFISRNIKKVLVGKDPLSIEGIHDMLMRKFIRWGRRGFVIHAISAIDIALWDILGKVSGKPLWKLLGGYRDVVPTYANVAFHLPPKQLAEKALSYVERGFNALKIRGARTEVSLDEATARIKEVRDLVGYDVKLMIDLNGTLSYTEAVEYCRRWERYELFWIEEPIHPDDFESYRKIRKLSNAFIAAGEHHNTLYDFKLLIENECVDIVQPDASWTGGITEWLKIWALATAYGLPVSPHALQLIHVHLVAAKPNTMWIEYFSQDNPLYAIMFHVFEEPKDALFAKNGVLKAPSLPGIGLKVKE